jgi:hypothetical protein
MSSLIEGWFRLINGHPLVNGSVVPTSSPTRKSYLSLFDACACLGPISAGAFVDCEIRLYLGRQDVEGKVVHMNGRFCVSTSVDRGEPFLQLEVHRFDVIDAWGTSDGSDDSSPDTLCTSITLCGRVVPCELVDEGPDKFFALEVNEYIRDRSQTFTIRFGVSSFPLAYLLMNLSRCRLNKTSSKRWEKTNVPIQGTMIQLSGFLGGDRPKDLFVEVEAMYFIPGARGMDSAGSSQSPNKSKFGTPTRFVYYLRATTPFDNDLAGSRR